MHQGYNFQHTSLTADTISHIDTVHDYHIHIQCPPLMYRHRVERKNELAHLQRNRLNLQLSIVPQAPLILCRILLLDFVSFCTSGSPGAPCLHAVDWSSIIPQAPLVSRCLVPRRTDACYRGAASPASPHCRALAARAHPYHLLHNSCIASLTAFQHSLSPPAHPSSHAMRSGWQCADALAHIDHLRGPTSISRTIVLLHSNYH